MSMAAQNLRAEGFGTCLAYGPPLTIGLPIDVNPDRPLVVAHPAAAMHYHASFGLFEDAGHPFIQMMVDWGDHNPLAWGSSATEYGMQTFQRIADTSEGHGVYRKAPLRLPHWQVHAVGDAYEVLTQKPPLDVLYMDWLAWLRSEPIGFDDGVVPSPSFAELVSSFVHQIREGGLIIVDHKHATMDEGHHPWYAFGTDEFIHLGAHTLLHNKGLIEWMAPNVDGDYQTHVATVFKVHHGIEGELANKDWEVAMQPWFWSTVPEMILQPNQVKTFLESGAEAVQHPDVTSPEEWFEAWAMTLDEHDLSHASLPPQPPLSAWPSGAYASFLQWLVDHPACLPPMPTKASYALLGQNFTLEFVYGDLMQLAPVLHTPQSVLAVRAGLAHKVVARCPWWLGQSLVLQTSEAWMSNPVKQFQWSGENATPLLAKQMLEHAKLQTQSGLYPSVKNINVNHVVTVAHGTASIGEVMRACEIYHATAPEYALLRPMKLTVVCLDEDDYSDLGTVLPSFQFLPDDGPCTS